ncbi:hypothetical protein EGC76_11830 [Pseudidiomarina gelatinasegens]|jgi:hypothetical protein|uniref:Uncharacterized protein n=1 Tax=Pseudidiomarina gelatinasegens TaxID=2487740 RepID=A0A443YVN1_9GAMM|nr:hypothetical protein [Pseudidiomarina gelatinasegens]RWU07918.1 hypothetical protein EGC76_11830 [Pseudidiomarina gelatinasegens]
MDILSTAIQVNVSTIILACIAGILVWRCNHPGKIRFCLGLAIVCLSGILAIPAAQYFSGSSLSLVTQSNIIGIFHGAGLLVCATAFQFNAKRV